MYIFAPQALLGTLAIAAGFTVLVLKSCKEGRAWLAEKLGENWQKRIFIQFLGWPSIVVGFLMFLPDHFWMDVLKLGIGFVIFIFWKRWYDKKHSKPKATSASDAGAAA